MSLRESFCGPLEQSKGAWACLHSPPDQRAYLLDKMVCIFVEDHDQKVDLGEIGMVGCATKLIVLFVLLPS